MNKEKDLRKLDVKWYGCDIYIDVGKWGNYDDIGRKEMVMQMIKKESQDMLKLSDTYGARAEIERINKEIDDYNNKKNDD